MKSGEELRNQWCLCWILALKPRAEEPWASCDPCLKMSAIVLHALCKCNLKNAIRITYIIIKCLWDYQVIKIFQIIFCIWKINVGLSGLLGLIIFPIPVLRKSLSIIRRSCVVDAFSGAGFPITIWPLHLWFFYNDLHSLPKEASLIQAFLGRTRKPHPWYSNNMAV